MGLIFTYFLLKEKQIYNLNYIFIKRIVSLIFIYETTIFIYDFLIFNEIELALSVVLIINCFFGVVFFSNTFWKYTWGTRSAGYKNNKINH